MVKQKRTVCIIVAVICIITGYHHQSYSRIFGSQVRVWLRVFRKRNSIRIINSKGLLLNNNTKPGYNLIIEKRGGVLYCNNKRYSSLTLVPVAHNRTAIKTRFGVKIYSGVFYLSIKNNSFYIVNHTDLKDYLAGVLSSELDSSFHIETLKAQAIASRSYLYYYSQRLNNSEIDAVDTDGRFQSFRGLQNVNGKIVKAVSDTKGLILSSNKKGFVPYFHSTCGGMLLSPAESWHNQPIKESNLTRRFDGPQKSPHCRLSPYYKWNVRLEKAVITGALGRECGCRVIDFTFSFDSYGFCKTVTLVLPGRQYKRIHGYLFKAFLERQGINGVRSVRFDVTRKGTVYTFKGRGFGHFVGMCQWGAEQQARNGKKFDELLQYYYPEAFITQVDSY